VALEDISTFQRLACVQLPQRGFLVKMGLLWMRFAVFAMLLMLVVDVVRIARLTRA